MWTISWTEGMAKHGYKGVDRTMDTMDTTVDRTLARSLSPQEVDLLGDAANREERVVLAVFLELGVSTGEAQSLLVADFDVAEGSVAIKGKRGKFRKIVPPSGIPQEVLEAIGGREPNEPLFPGRSGRKITTRAIQRWLTRLAMKAGLPPQLVTVNNLRRTFVTMRQNWGVQRLSAWLGLRLEGVAQLLMYEPPSREGTQLLVPSTTRSPLLGGRPRVNQERDGKWLGWHQQGRSYARIALAEGLGPAGREIVAKAVQREAKRQGVSTH